MDRVRYCVLRDAALTCTFLFWCAVAPAVAQMDGDVRLTGGNHPLQGYLQVYKDNAWGTVCNEGWDKVDADVVCTQIGSIGGAMFTESKHSFTSVDGNLKILMSEVVCEGTERKLADCAHTNVTSCAHATDVRMDCVIPGYQACVVFNDSSNPPLAGRRHHPAGGMSVSTCTQLCREDGYHYSGVNTLECFCGAAGENFMAFGTVSNERCDAYCPGEGSQNCGAENLLAVHEVIVGGCSAMIKSQDGAVTSPGFPGMYPQDTRTCQWVIDVSDNGDTTVKFPIFSLADGDILEISTDGRMTWTQYYGDTYRLEITPPTMTFDQKNIVVRFVMKGTPKPEVGFVMTFQDDTTCEIIDFANGTLDVAEGAIYRPGDAVVVLCERHYVTEWRYTVCRQDGLWHKPPKCTKEPPRVHSLVFTSTYLFMMLAAIGSLGLIFFMIICGVICVGRKKKQEGYTGISRQESAEPTKVENEFHVDMHGGSDIDMHHAGGDMHDDGGDVKQGIPLASGAAMDE